MSNFLEAAISIEAQERQEEQALLLQSYWFGDIVTKRQLIYASKTNDLKTIQKAYRLYGPQVTETPISKDQATLMHWVAAYSPITILKYLVMQGCTMNMLDQYGRNPLEWSMRCNNFNNRRFLEEYFLTKSKLIRAAKRSDLVAIQKAYRAYGFMLLEMPLSYDRASLIHWAAAYSSVNVLDYLVMEGFSIDIVDINGCYPLDWASFHKNDGNFYYLENLRAASMDDRFSYLLPNMPNSFM